MPKLTIEEMQQIARERGGKCLSKKYENAKTKLIWQCIKGHTWEAEPDKIKRGGWCPECGGSQRATIEQMQEVAKKRGGNCLSKEYVNNVTKLKWQCKKGHEWEAVPHNIEKGRWCPECADQKNKLPKKRYTIEDMQQIALEHGGKCLSNEYVNTTTKLKWQCEKGHIWETAPRLVMYQKAWCPKCGGTKKMTIEDMEKIAKKYGGRCLSRKYINNRTKLTWQCKEGHEWEAMPIYIIEGTWCSECAGVKKATIEEMQEIAESRGGKCLSKEYKNKELKLKWKCGREHVWEATAHAVKCGTWCPECVGKKKLGIKKMKEIAKERGGKCLSKEYKNRRSKLTWQCEKGHTWESTPKNIKAGSWCPECRKRAVKS